MKEFSKICDQNHGSECWDALSKDAFPPHNLGWGKLHWGGMNVWNISAQPPKIHLVDCRGEAAAGWADQPIVSSSGRRSSSELTPGRRRASSRLHKFPPCKVFMHRGAEARPGMFTFNNEVESWHYNATWVQIFPSFKDLTVHHERIQVVNYL